MQSLQKPIGILGGTFDPVHTGHLEIAKAVYRECHLAEIRFIPCKQPVLKTKAEASTKQRLEMLQLALQDYPHFIIDEREVKRDSPSYMVETLTSLQSDFPQTPLCLILGMDAFLELPQWHEWEKIIALSHLIVINRPHFPLPKTEPLATFYQQHHSDQISSLNEKLSGAIITLTLPALPFASRSIRQQIKNGENVANALPPAVWSYIKKHKIYQKL